MENDNKKFTKYLLVFGLKENFTSDELVNSYRILAKLNHPDINKHDNADQIMKNLNEGFHFLKGYTDTDQRNELEKYDRTNPEKTRAEDIFYDQYKKGFQILTSAFDNYYGEKEDKSLTGNITILTMELRRAKIEFAVLINDLPYNQWVNDAIDKVNSINKWLDPE